MSSSTQSSQERPSPEQYYPDYVDPDDVEFSHAVVRCRCGWRSDPQPHPGSADYQREMHIDYYDSPDCSLPKIDLVFADGSEATIT